MSIAIVNAAVWTGDQRRPWAQAVGISGDRISIVGSNEEVRRNASSATRTIDAQGSMVAPGFIDSHVHFLTGGLNLASVQLRDAHSPAEFISRIKAFAATLQPGVWITGGDWDHQNWGGELPQRSWIDSVTPNNPVWINRLGETSDLPRAAELKDLSRLPDVLDELVPATF